MAAQPEGEPRLPMFTEPIGRQLQQPREVRTATSITEAAGTSSVSTRNASAEIEEGVASVDDATENKQYQFSEGEYVVSDTEAEPDSPPPSPPASPTSTPPLVTATETRQKSYNHHHR